MKLMADDDDDEVFEVTAISEQLDLRRKYAQIKKVQRFKIKGRKEYDVFDGLQLLLVSLYFKSK